MTTQQTKMKTTYRISDGNATETAATLSDASGICEDWYDCMVDEGRIPDACFPDLDDSSLDALNESIRAWENRIAAACGNKSFAGHGSYYVSAGDSMGLNLSVSEVADMKPTAKQLTKLDRVVDAASASLRRMNNLRMGVIEGAPSNESEQRELNAARAEILSALRAAGPRLRKQFHAEDWERSFKHDGDLA